MEKNKIITVHYSQKGHYQYPEDTWSDSCIVSNEKELYKAFKEWYRQLSMYLDSFFFCLDLV